MKPRPPTPPQRVPRGKIWGFRLLAIVGGPALFLVLLELGLRVCGFGYPTAFLLPALQNGQPVLTQNNQFGWRFFGPELARLPHPFSISQTKPPEVIRIFVFGESAAKGDPDPNFGLSRMLEAMLALRHPGVRFEVVNTAMTAINSHAILPIARDCAAAQGDVWVVYMGNNEVVGPFGAGTIFGPQSPPLAMVRSALMVKSWRTGQWLDGLLQRTRTAATSRNEWGGMEMFLEQQVRSDDPRMAGVYQNFERNLADILHFGRQAGAGIVVSTVAVNLKDCAPFGSAHRAGFSETVSAKWGEVFQRGIHAQNLGEMETAVTLYAEAAKLDDTYAELRFRQGQCALAQGRRDEALKHFEAARDLDTLRFRCDARLNGATRKLAAGRESERILLADAERVFAASAVEGVPGGDFFLEHVHLKFEGNWLLARTIGSQVEALLANRLAKNSVEAGPWPAPEDCARRLGWSDRSRWVAWKGVLPRLGRPPFTGQFDHDARMTQLQTNLLALASATQPRGISNALRICEEALVGNPDDWALLRQAASLRKSIGDRAGALAAGRRAVELIPSDAEGWLELGLMQAREDLFGEALDSFQRAAALNSRDFVSIEGVAQCLSALGRKVESLARYDELLKSRPNLATAWLHQGQLLEQMGRGAEAQKSFARARANPGQNAESLTELADFCQRRGWFDSAADFFVRAAAADPTNAKLHVGAGQNFAALNRYDDAFQHSAAAVRIAPEFAEAHLLHGLVLGRQKKITEAAGQFREAVRLNPDLTDAHLNLGLALVASDPVAALAEFETVLRQSPTNATAIKFARQMRGRQ